jgi:hypothetical protein
MSSASGKNVTLTDLPKEIILGLAATHLDPVDPPALHALVSLIDMGLVDAKDVEELYAHQHERPFPWEWLVAWPDHFKATFANEGRASPITVWLEKLFVEACRRGWIDLIELLVCRGARPLTDHLIDAASAGMNDVIDLLVVQYGLDPHRHIGHLVLVPPLRSMYVWARKHDTTSDHDVQCGLCVRRCVGAQFSVSRLS